MTDDRTLLKEIGELEKTKTIYSDQEMMARIQAMLQNSPTGNDSDEIFQLWMTYATNVNDPWTVCQYMFDSGVGKQRVRLYSAWALFLEKYRRDFTKVSDVFILGLATLLEDRFRAELLDKYKQFADRMQKRSERDVHAYLPKNETNKRRTFEQAFGSEKTKLGEKRIKLPEGTEKVKEYDMTIQEYLNGITLVR